MRNDTRHGVSHCRAFLKNAIAARYIDRGFSRRFVQERGIKLLTLVVMYPLLSCMPKHSSLESPSFPERGFEVLPSDAPTLPREGDVVISKEQIDSDTC